MVEGKERQKEEKAGYKSTVPAVDQAMRVLLCLAGSTSAKMNLTDICARVGIYKSKGYSILNTLQQFGFVQRDTEGKLYSLGPGLISLSRRALDSLSVREVVRPFLESLATETKIAAFFGMIVDESMFVIAKREGEGDIGITVRLGHRYELTHGAHGKAILSALPEKERQAMLARDDLYFHGDPSKLDRQRLMQEIEACRLEGYAVDQGEMSPVITAVAAPVLAMDDRPVGALFILGIIPGDRIAAYGRVVSENARDVSIMLGASTGPRQ